MRRVTKLVAVAGSILLVACETNAAPTPAVLASADDETMEVVSAVLAQALERASITLGAGDPTRESVIAVLPPPPGPNEDRSLATPDYFDLMLKGNDCFVVRRDSGEEYPLTDIPCRAR